MVKEQASKSSLAIALRVYLCAIVVLLPWKFTCYVGNGEQPNFPMDIWEWMFFSLPCYLTSLLCGLALVFAALVHPVPRANRSALVPLIWSLPIVTGLVGLVKTTELDYAIQWIGHFAGLASFCVAVWWSAANDRKVVPVLLHTIGLVGLISCLHGLYQHFWGFEAMKRLTLEQAAANHTELSGQMLQKLEQTRVYSTFIDPNVFASYLLLCFPFSLLAMYRWGLRFEKPRLGSRALLVTGIVLFLGCLYWTGSRGAALGAAAGLACAVWTLPRVRTWRWRWLVPGAAILLALLLVVLTSLQKSRGGLASASVRIGYYKACVQMFAESPFFGAGTGEFFSHYLKEKAPGAEVARNPHSFYLGLLGEQGLLGALAGLAILLLPWLTATFFPPKDNARQPLFTAACAATAAWTIHSAFQFNELVPGVAYLTAFAGILAFDEREGRPLPKALRFLAITLGLVSCLFVLRTPSEHAFQRAEYLEKENLPRALEFLQKAAAYWTRPPGPVLRMQNIHFSQGNLPKAEETARELISRTPHRAASHLRLARASLAHALSLHAKGEPADAMYQNAENALKSAQEWYPFDPEILLLRAVMPLFRNGKLPTHLTSLLAILHLQPAIHEDGEALVVTFNDSPFPDFPQLLQSSKIQALDGRPVTFLATSQAPL